MAAQGEIPLLQDDSEARVWERWGASYRDVIVLDHENQIVEVFNLTTHDLQQADAYEALRELLLDKVEADQLGR